MRKQVPVIEWEIAKNDADWEHLCPPRLPSLAPAATHRLRLKRYYWSVSVLLLLLASAGGWWWRTEQAALPHPTTDVTVTTQTVLGTVPSHRDSLVDTVIGDQTTTHWRRQFNQEESNGHAVQANPPAANVGIKFSQIVYQDDQALIRVVMYTEHRAPAYRQTRFYRRTSTGWVQTAPDVALWGPARSLETPYFVYHFRQNDAKAVVAVLPQMDALYRILRHNFGLSLTPDPEKLLIDVSVTLPPGYVAPGFGAPHRFPVSSPALYVAPIGLTDAELLEQSIALPLLEQVVAQASERYEIGLSWQSVLNGLYLWQAWDRDLPLSAWRDEVVRWLYLDLSGASAEQLVVLPDQYEELCAAHTLWMPAPVQLGIPLLCTELDWKNWYFASWGSRDPLTRLDQFSLQTPKSLVEPVSVSHPGQTVSLATLIEYAVATYGRERLPALLAGLGQYESWDTLIPAVYGVSTAEFEAGWQAYLKAHYGISSAH